MIRHAGLPRPQRRRGATLVESTIVIALFLFFLFGIFEWGRYIMVRQLCQHACREGCRHAVVNTDTATEAQIRDIVYNSLAAQHVHLDGFDKNTDITITGKDTAGNTINWYDCKFGESIIVSVQGDVRPILAGYIIKNATLPCNATCVMTSEAN